MPALLNCPLCDEPASATRSFVLPPGRRARACPNCFLIWVDPADHLSRERERERYRLHRNDPDDPGYGRFLRQLIDPMVRFLRPGARGLDFGCGPTPAGAHLLRSAGFTCDLYDPLFHDRPPSPPYDFIFAGEVFEHFRRPGEEIARVCALLAPGGILGIMTERWRTPEAVAGWPYATDPTHVAFYHARTIEWLARRQVLAVLYQDEGRVTVLRGATEAPSRVSARPSGASSRA